MNRECGFCGEIVPQKSNACPRCGNKFSEKYFDDDYENGVIVNNPSWGAINFDFSNYSGNMEDELEKIKVLWEEYEKDSTMQLSLFWGQFIFVSSNSRRIRVYGPKGVVEALIKALSLAISKGLVVGYEQMPLDEIHRIQTEHVSRLASMGRQ